MNRGRGVPDLEFIDTDLEKLRDTLIQGGEFFTGRTLHKGDPVRLFILWLVDILHQHRVQVNHAASQNIPRYAKGIYLDELGFFFNNVTRLPEAAATTTLRFTLSEARPSTVIIPKGTRATPDGTILFSSLEDLQIPPGEINGEVGAVCLEKGEVGNGFLPGQIKLGVDIHPFQKSVENITTSEGGADKEDDDSFYYRMREEMESYSTAGPEGAYKAHAKRVSSLIADVATDSPAPGIADIRVLLKEGKLPGEELLQRVEEELSGATTRPFTDYVTVSPPDIRNFRIDLTYYTPKLSEKSFVDLPSAVEQAVREYVLWQTQKMGRDINPSVLLSMLMDTGVKRVEIRSPVFTVVEKTEVAQLETQTVIHGGMEDE